MVDHGVILGRTWHRLFIPRLGKNQILDGAKNRFKRKILCCTARCCMSCWWAPIPLMVSEIQSMHKFETPLEVRWNWWTFDISIQRWQLEATRSFFSFWSLSFRRSCRTQSTSITKATFFSQVVSMLSSPLQWIPRTGQRVVPWQPQVSRQWESLVKISEYINYQL